jgi:aspartate 1-decarboxylase
MYITKFYSKIHRATVTQADLAYEGSITIDSHLLDCAHIKEFQQVHIYNITSGNRFETYALKGEAHSGVIQINGAAAHKATIGDLVIIVAYAQMDEAEFDAHEPTVVLVDAQNRPVASRQKSDALAV